MIHVRARRYLNREFNFPYTTDNCSVSFWGKSMSLPGPLKIGSSFTLATMRQRRLNFHLGIIGFLSPNLELLIELLD